MQHVPKNYQVSHLYELDTVGTFPTHLVYRLTMHLPTEASLCETSLLNSTHCLDFSDQQAEMDQHFAIKE